MSVQATPPKKAIEGLPQDTFFAIPARHIFLLSELVQVRPPPLFLSTTNEDPKAPLRRIGLATPPLPTTQLLLVKQTKH